jgi:hypothetical protein
LSDEHMKPEEKPLPVRAPEGQGAWDTHNIKAAVGMALWCSRSSP